MRHEGVAAAPRPQTLYGSVEMHSSLQRAVEVLGLGSKALRRIPVDAADRIDMAALRRAIEADLAEGRQPICLVGNAGTVNTGAIDPLDELAEVARAYGLWYHVDGAFGALAASRRNCVRCWPAWSGPTRSPSTCTSGSISPSRRAACLVRDAEMHRRAFTLRPDYLRHAARGLASGNLWFSDYGDRAHARLPRAQGLDGACKNAGVDKMGRLIRQNVEQAAYLAALVEASPRLELLAPVALNIVCFRYRRTGA